ncbi:MAG: CBS domain-containing protein [Bdellovibrionales bacterium]
MEKSITYVPKTIKDIMSRNVETVLPNALLTIVAQKMQKRDCGCVLVTSNDRIVGIITDRDLVLRCIAKSHDPAGTTAAQVMSSEILYCRDTDGADAVTKNMGENKVRRLAVLDSSKRLVGIVTLGDLASHTNHKLCGEVLGEICRA